MKPLLQALGDYCEDTMVLLPVVSIVHHYTLQQFRMWASLHMLSVLLSSIAGGVYGVGVYPVLHYCRWSEGDML